jgi:hypothetical protein
LGGNGFHDQTGGKGPHASIARKYSTGNPWKYWTADGLLRQVVYEGLREDKAARDVRRE